MFTGIISALGRIENVASLATAGQDTHGFGVRLRVQAPPNYLDDVQLGDSIALNGACMTVTEFDMAAACFTIEVSGESLSKTHGLDAVGAVNLEKALRPNDRMGGHFVTGHVDGLGRILALTPLGESHILRIGVDAELGRYIAAKGSVTVHGVSLTVNTVHDEPNSASACQFEINLIDHTWRNTVFQHMKQGDAVHIEIDLMARYAARWVSTPAGSNAEKITPPGHTAPPALYRHVKTGRLYAWIAQAKNCTNGDQDGIAMAVYRSVDENKVFTRVLEEFLQRFEAVR